MFELVHRLSLPLINGHAVDVNLNSSLAFDLWPLGLELFHHDLPLHQALFVEFLNLLASVLLELVQSVFSLNYCCFGHEESKLVVSCEGLESSPVLLNTDGSKNRSLDTFELRVSFHLILYLVLIENASIQIMLSWGL